MIDPATARLYGEVAKAAFAPEPANVFSGMAPFDARASFNAAGWTVSTGRSSATGAALTGDPATAAYGPLPAESGVIAKAGQSYLLPIVLLSVAAALWLRKKKGG